MLSEFMLKAECQLVWRMVIGCRVKELLESESESDSRSCSESLDVEMVEKDRKRARRSWNVRKV